MTTKSAAVAPEGKRYKYYGREYKLSVKDMAELCDVSLRTMKDVLKLHSMGYTAAMAEGWTVAQCFAHAGKAKRKPAPTKATVKDFKTVIIYYREQMDDAVYEIRRLRDLLHDLGVDPDG